jgi:hypothetical protein
MREIYDECVRAGVKSNGKTEAKDGAMRDPLYENIAYHLWRWRQRGLVASKRAGGEDARRKRRESAAGAPDVGAAVLRAAVEPIAKDRLLTIVAATEAEAMVDAMLADGRLVKFASGKLMASEDKA